MYIVRKQGTNIEAISAILAKTREKPAETMTKPQIRPAVPPSVSALASRLSSWNG
jgi:hypothetical protein